MRFPFVFPQEGGEEEGKERGGELGGESAKINIFASAVQPQEKYEHVGEEIKMMDLLADVCVCSCVCMQFSFFGGCHNCGIVSSARRFQVWRASFEAYMQDSIG